MEQLFQEVAMARKLESVWLFLLQKMNISGDKVFDLITEVHLKESRLFYVNFLFALYKMHLIISCYLPQFKLICLIYIVAQIRIIL